MNGKTESGECTTLMVKTKQIVDSAATKLSNVKRNRALLGLLSLTVASLAVLFLVPPISQDQSYHAFADQRTLLGIPHFWNVVSNLPFIAVGAMGLWQFHRQAA